MSVNIAPDARRQFLNASGVPYSGAKLFYYASGSTTKQNTYTTSVGNVANSNPIVLDSAGRTPYGIWLTAGLTYKEVLAPSTDTDPPGSPIYTEDGISGINDTSGTVSQWEASALTPTYISGTSFRVAGDQTTELHIGRRLQLSVTAGTVYALISNSVYGALTTVTVVMDSGALDSGLSSFNWSILTAANHALPKLTTTLLSAIGIANTTDYAPLASPTFTGTVDLTGAVLAGSTPLAFDGATAGTNKTSFSVVDPTANRTITVPNADVDLTLVRGASQTLSGVLRQATGVEAQTGTDSTTSVSPASLGSTVLGLGQTYTDVTGSRVAGNTYTNATGRTISISVIAITAAAVNFIIEGLVSTVRISYQNIYANASGVCGVCTMIIPPGATYVVNLTSCTISKWMELR